MALLSTKDFGEQVNLTYGRIVQLIQAGELEAEKIGRDYLIEDKYVEVIKNRPERRGRKPNSAKGVISV